MSSGTRLMDRTPVRWGIYILVAALFAVACWFLAQWQFDRGQERAQQLALIEQNYDAPVVDWTEVVSIEKPWDPQIEWRQVKLTGQYASADQLLVRNRPHGGANTFEVVVPFHSADGGVFLINRGWVPQGNTPEPAFIPEVPTGELTIVARIRPGESLPGRGAPEGQIPTIHLPLVAEQVDGDLVTSAYGQLISETTQTAAALGGFDVPTDDPGPHLSYAVQWILFAVMGFIFIGYMIRTETTKYKEREAREGHRRGKQDRDSETEDAILEEMLS